MPGKEKARKPVDPPPILELSVNEHEDPRQQFLQSPYLFASVTLFKSEADEPVDAAPDKVLTGTLVSSLHRLKDVSNKDGGFFVFGDVSVKMQGTFRLHFTLFNFDTDTNEMRCLTSVTSAKFKVLMAKDFRGMEESTYLSRAFADQGVRLRLRKEARATKRSFQAYDSQEETASSPKRQRQDVQISPYPTPTPAFEMQTPATNLAYQVPPYFSSNQAGSSTSYAQNPTNQYAPNAVNQYAASQTNQYRTNQYNANQANQTNQYGTSQASQYSNNVASQYSAAQASQFNAGGQAAGPYYDWT